MKKKGKIESHRKSGSKLIAPFNELPNTSFYSWMNDRLPCMIWAALLITNLGREKALEKIRRIGKIVGEEFHTQPEEFKNSLPRISIYGISLLNQGLRDAFFKELFVDEISKIALRPLGLIEALPLRAEWQKNLAAPTAEDWTTLAESVAATLDHQSQEATDCRWAYMLPIIYSGKIHMPEAYMYQEYTDYPYFNAQEQVRPSIRATEIQFGAGMMAPEYAEQKVLWAKAFWNECKTKTACLFADPEIQKPDYNIPKTINSLRNLWHEIAEHFSETDNFTHVQAKRDACFGFALYAVTVAQEAIASSGRMITAKLALRMLAEIAITFTYLIYANDKKLWDTYRSYGSSQAKLTFLKLDEIITKEPGYLKKDHIKSLANEDIYMDFQDIELGNWAKLDLRTMSQMARCKEIYDTYYSWPSTYAHGQWCAVRDTVFTTCINPLHRLHRIPRTGPRYEDRAESDIILLLNKILELLNSQYPEFKNRSQLEL